MGNLGREIARNGMSEETNEISIHMVRIVRVLRSSGWMTVKGIATSASVARRTAAKHLLCLLKLGLIDQAEVFPGHRNRWSEMAGKRNAAFVERLDRAAVALGEAA